MLVDSMAKKTPEITEDEMKVRKALDLLNYRKLRDLDRCKPISEMNEKEIDLIAKLNDEVVKRTQFGTRKEEVKDPDKETIVRWADSQALWYVPRYSGFGFRIDVKGRLGLDKGENEALVSVFGAKKETSEVKNLKELTLDANEFKVDVPMKTVDHVVCHLKQLPLFGHHIDSMFDKEDPNSEPYRVIDDYARNRDYKKTMNILEQRFKIDFDTIDAQLLERNKEVENDIEEFEKSKEKLKELRHKNAELMKKIYTSSGNVRKTLTEEEVENLRDESREVFDEIRKLDETVEFYKNRKHLLHKKFNIETNEE